MTSATYSIPLKLPSLNDYINAQRKNKYLGAKVKKETEESIMWFVKSQGVKSLNSPVSVEIEWYEANRKRDPDNIYSAKKFLMDSLVKTGVLRGDGWKDIASITDRHYLSSEVGNFKDYGVIVTLKEV